MYVDNMTLVNTRKKGSIFDDALDDKEYEGNLIYLLNSGSEFIRNNSKVRFVKKAQYRDRKSTRLNSSHPPESRMPSSA